MTPFHLPVEIGTVKIGTVTCSMPVDFAANAVEDYMMMISHSTLLSQILFAPTTTLS
jgi:hypothetical protein